MESLSSPLHTTAVRGIFFDIDGTLLSTKTHRIPETAIAALLRAHDCGMLLFIATGRHKKNLLDVPQLAELPLDAFVGLNGQYCWNKTETLYTNPIPKEDVKALLNFAIDTQCGCELLGVDEFITTNLTQTMKMAFDRVAITHPIVAPNPFRALEIDILQIDLYPEPATSLAILDTLPSCKWSYWGEGAIDIMVATGGKWSGIQEVMKRFHLSDHEIMVFGDEENDVEMLRRAPLSVAMGNGCDNAKSAAAYVADHVDNNGLFGAMRTLLPQLRL